MTKEDILTWLMTFGREWVDWNDLHDLFKIEESVKWLTDDINVWHDAMHVTKRYKVHSARDYQYYTEQYRLTERAIKSLEEV